MRNCVLIVCVCVCVCVCVGMYRGFFFFFSGKGIDRYHLLVKEVCDTQSFKKSTHENKNARGLF